MGWQISALGLGLRYIINRLYPLVSVVGFRFCKCEKLLVDKRIN